MKWNKMVFQILDLGYQEAKTDGNNDSGGNGDGSKIEVTKMASERLSNDSHGEHSKATEYRGTRNLP